MKMNKNMVITSLLLIAGLVVLFSPRFVVAASGAWTLQTLDPSQVYATSIALDTDGHSHISYCDESKNLKYIYWDGSSWVGETVVADGNVGQHTSLALDSANYPHIIYYDSTSRVLQYVHWTGSSWASETVDNTTGVGRFPCLVLDNSDHPHISYTDDTHSTLRYARWTGASWAIETVDDVDDGAYWTSIVLDSDGYPHISYQDYHDHYDLKYARWTGSAWNISVVDSTDMVGWCSSIALDSNEYPHISYYDGTNQDLKYAHWTGTSWVIESVDSDGRVGNYTSIALDNKDRPHIGYAYSSATPTDNALKYARWTGTAWVKETVASGFTEEVGATSLVLDRKGYPHISYATFSVGSLHYAFIPVPFSWNLFLPAITKSQEK
ncbi:MAG: hypothetical protein Q7U88_11365 [Desulfocapsaceae bacterium]|nr:hypothetical protein [Desulfocapsaceae bacterium]